MPIKEVMQMRREIALKMKVDGKTYLEIGNELGISRRCAAYLLAPTESERKELEDRTNGTCALCGKKKRSMIAHHDDYKNGCRRILCRSCHMKVHGELHTPRNYYSRYLVKSQAVKVRRVSVVMPDDMISWLQGMCKDKERVSDKVFAILDSARQLHEKLQPS